jgi:2-phosphosulfolactate phosphatase
MTVNVFDPSCDAASIRGFTVVVDVFRAFSVSYFIAAQKPSRYLVVDDVDLAFELRDRTPGAVLVGERGGFKIAGFDFGNSPTEILAGDLSGKTVIHTTTAGTKGLARQPAENEVAAGSFVNARAIARYAVDRGLDEVNVYCTAERGNLHGEEDYLFADYLSALLTQDPTDFPAIRERLRAGSGKGFSEIGFAPESDFAHCMSLDRFDAVLRRFACPDEPRAFELK